jgi:diadenosine tetraphosphate (Ap4A) HIT family hydrolase
MTCELCDADGGEVLLRTESLRVVRVVDANYPAFCRVIWNRHVKEMTDLKNHEQTKLMQTVFAVETALRATIKPDKMNLASLGNMTPHVHWHVIPRFSDDPHFPQPIWAAAQRATRIKIDLVDFDKKMKLALQKAMQSQQEF